MFVYVPTASQLLSQSFPTEKELLEYGWQVTFGIITQLFQEVTADGAELAIVLIGPADVVEMALMKPAEQEAVFQKFSILRDAQPDLPTRKFLEELSGQNVNILDLHPLLVEQIRATKSPLFFSTDKHWNVEGNRFVAESIFNWLKETSRIPGGIQ
jgi:hypothetical protein